MPHIFKELGEGIKCFFYARRYGYRPIPSEIDTAELLKLRTTLVGMKNDVHLMDKWLVLKTCCLFEGRPEPSNKRGAF